MLQPLTLVLDQVHLSYMQRRSTRGTWTSLPSCLPDRAAAERLRDAATALAGSSAAARRTWTITPCTCRGDS